MQKTDIDWCDMSWNPITGCLHSCEWCYARGIARRFGGWDYSCGMVRGNIADDKTYIALTTDDFRNWGCKVYEVDGHKVAELENAYLIKRGHKTVKAPYPFGFMPTFHRYRLDETRQHKKPQTIFVGSMCDMFGEWVPNEWIKAVFEATNRAPQHQYLYLTKNPDRYYQLGEGDSAIIPDSGASGWFGASASTEKMAQSAWENLNCCWISIEPIFGDFSEDFFYHDVLSGSLDHYYEDIAKRWSWVVVGAESGQRKGKVIPERKWIENLITNCREAGTKLFMKESLRNLMGDDFIQEYPWEVSK